MQGLETRALVMGAPRRLAVDGDEIVPVRPEGRDPAIETAPEQHRIDPVDERTQPALAGNAMVKLGKAAQKTDMMLAPGRNIVKIVARCDRGAGEKQQHLGKRIHHTPLFPIISQARKLCQQHSQTCFGTHIVKG